MKLSAQFATLNDMEILGVEGDMSELDDMADVARVLARCLYRSQLFDLQEALEKEIEHVDALQGPDPIG